MSATLVRHFIKFFAKKRFENYFKSSERSYPAVRKRFYKIVHVTESDGKYEINLDKHKLKTPLGKLFQLPNEALATVVASEWQTQEEVLQPQSMHLMNLCNTALDNPCRQSKESLTDSILEFLATDTLCYRSQEPPDFVALQKNQWNPLLSWFEDKYDVRIDVCDDVTGIPVPQETISKVKKHLLSYNSWCLLGINFAVENLKSVILTLAVMNHIVNVETAVNLSRLETNFQIEHWGNIDWSHDVEKAQTTSRVAAACLFAYLNENSTTLIKKTPSRQDPYKSESVQIQK